MATLIEMVKVAALIVAILLLASIAYAIIEVFIQNIKMKKTTKELGKEIENLLVEELPNIFEEIEKEEEAKKTTKKATRKPRKPKEKKEEDE